MAQIGSCWAQPSWADDVWGAGTWAGSVTPPVTVTPASSGGGRRLRNEDDEKKRVKTRPLTQQERRELDRLFRDDAPEPVAKPRDSEPRAPAPLPVQQSAPSVTPAAAWVEKARHVAALDAIGEYLQRVPRTVGDDSRRRAYQRAVEAAQRAEQEQQQRVIQLAAEQDRIQQAAAADAQERQRQADEDELMAVLLAIHELS